MKILIRQATIIDSSSPHNGQTTGVLIEDGLITKIGDGLAARGCDEVIEAAGACISPGWFDLNAFLGDPGFEHKEDLHTGIAAAAAGGFTAVCCLPNTRPAIHSKSEVEYVVNKSRGNIVNVLPIGALSYNCEGKEITEMYDMRYAGAIAFSDGYSSRPDAGMMLRSLQYVKPFGGVIISFPHEANLAVGGVIHEGEVSTRMGLKGIPALAEELIVSRDIELAGYTGSKVHFAYLSTKRSVELVREAKAQGLSVTCSVSPFSLAFTDEVVAGYDANYKVLPPLRAESDRQALREGLKDGTIDALASGHLPQDGESKDKEFDLANFGMITLEALFGWVNQSMDGQWNEEQLVERLAMRPRAIVGLPVPSIQENRAAEITIFDPSKAWRLAETDIRSKARNTPLIGAIMKGRVIGIFNKNQLHLNEPK